MPTIGKLKEELEDIEVIRSISGAQLEVAALRIRQIKSDFERNYEFFDEINELYNIVKLSASRLHEKKKETVHQVAETEPIQKVKNKTKGTISVAITSNRRFHGLLNSYVMEALVGDLIKKDSNCLVIGNTGKTYLEDGDLYGRCEYITFKDDYPTPGEANKFMNRLADYNQVLLYYPKFVTVFSQEIGVIDIGQAPLRDKEHAIEKTKEIEYIYEPELPKINKFFETQVRRLLFMRIMLESELARTSARLVKMNTIEIRAEDMMKERNQDLRKELLIQNDTDLLESFSSVQQWNK